MILKKYDNRIFLALGPFWFIPLILESNTILFASSRVDDFRFQFLRCRVYLVILRKVIQCTKIDAWKLVGGRQKSYWQMKLFNMLTLQSELLHHFITFAKSILEEIPLSPRMR